MSVGLTDKVRAIIEQGPPEELVATFRKLFEGKIKETKCLAAQAAQRYGSDCCLDRLSDPLTRPVP